MAKGKRLASGESGGSIGSQKTCSLLTRNRTTAAKTAGLDLARNKEEKLWHHVNNILFRPIIMYAQSLRPCPRRIKRPKKGSTAPKIKHVSSNLHSIKTISRSHGGTFTCVSSSRRNAFCRNVKYFFALYEGKKN